MDFKGLAIKFLGYVFAISLFGSQNCKAQSTTLHPFQKGEKIVYGAYYNWNFIWIKSGEVQFEVDLGKENKLDYYQFHAKGNTLKAYDLIYKVRNDFYSKSKVNSFETIEFKRTISHGRNHSEHYYVVDEQEAQIFSDIKRGKEGFMQDTIQTIPGWYDMLSAAYFTRTLEFEKYAFGQIIPIQILVDNSIHNLHFKYLGQEDVKTRNGLTFRCHKISILLMKGDFFPEGEYMKVWFTTNKNRIPVMVETKINVGSVKAVLEEYEGIKYPLDMKQLN